MMIICHGYKSSHTHPAIEAITNQLAARGHTVFAFNFSKSASSVDVQEQVANIQSITNHFSDHKEFIIIAGSYGALSGSIAAARFAPIKGLVTINGFFGTDQLRGKTLRTYKIFTLLSYIVPHYKRILNYYKKALQPHNILVPSLVIYTEKDELIDSVQSKDFYTKLQNSKQAHALKNADHHLTSRGAVEEVVQTIDTWIQQKK